MWNLLSWIADLPLLLGRFFFGEGFNEMDVDMFYLASRRREEEEDDDYEEYFDSYDETDDYQEPW